MVKINGSSFALQYKRTTGRPIDSTATFKTLEDATSYARNTDAEEYFPYPGQIISVEVDGGIYKLLIDTEIPDTDGRKHYKLSPINTGEESDGKYISKIKNDEAKGNIAFLAGIDVKTKAVIQKIIAEYATFSKEISSEEYVQNLLGWLITPSGDIDAKSLRLRDFLEVPELRYNRVSVITGEEWNAPGGGIIESVDEENSIVYLKLEPGEVAAVEVDDICKANFNNDTGFQTTYFRITEKLDNGSFKYVLRSGYTYHPQKAMHFVCYGNFTNAERQKSSYSTQNYIRFLKGVNNWEITKDMIAMQLGDLSNLKLFGMDMTGHSAYLNRIYMTGTIKQISNDGVTEVPVPAFKGEWKAGTYWYYDEVTHNGSTWICIESTTTQEPSDSSTDWLKVISKGEDGTSGKGVKSIVEQYYLSTSQTSLTGGSWSTTPPTWEKGKYIWTRSVITYTDDSTTTTDPISVTGGAGENGLGVKSVDVFYYLSSSSSELIGGEWSTIAPTWVNGKYMWSKTKTTYTDDTFVESNPVCITGGKGEDGKDGKGVQSVDVLYYLSSSSTSLSGGSWSTNSPTWVDGKYIWSKTKVVYTDGSSIETNPACITGGKGSTGDDGRGILSIVEEYYLSTSSNSLVGGSWSTTPPAWENGKYIWTRSVITYTDSTSTTTSPICSTGSTGETGIGVKSVAEQYYLSTSYSTPTGGSWQTSVPAWQDGKYIWTRVVITYTNNTYTETDPVCVTGGKGPSGNDGVGISAVDVFYYLSSSSSELIGGEWSTIAPTWVNGKYMWSKTKTTYTDDTFVESNPVCITGGKGEDGKDGKGVQSVDVLYYLSSSSTSLSGGSWSTNSPTWVDGKYIWSKTKVVYTDGSSIETNPACITGGKGSTGDDGRGILSIVEEYYLSTSSNSLVGGSWSTTPPAWENGKYIWTRSVITYTDSTSTTTSPICSTGSTGETGIGVKSVAEQYYLSTSYSTPTGGSWQTSVPAWQDGKYIWTRVVITYTNNTYTETDPVCVTGGKGPSGNDGVGISAVDVLFYLSTSSSSLEGGAWSTTSPAWEDGKYLWTKTKVTYTNGSTWESDPACITGSQGKTGLPGAMLRPRGVWKENTEYYNNETFIDTVIYNGQNKLCKITHTSTTSFDSTKWEDFHEFENVATNVLLAQNATIDVLGSSGIFVGNLDKTKGWIMTEGSIKHNVTGVELTSDGKISLPETGGINVGGKTFIEAGKIKTEFIDVDTLQVTHLKGAIGSFEKLTAGDGSITFGDSSEGPSSALNIDFSRTWFGGDLYQQGYNYDESRSWRFYASDLWCRGEFGHYKMTKITVSANYSANFYVHVYGYGTDTSEHKYPESGRPIDCVVMEGSGDSVLRICESAMYKEITVVNNSNYPKRVIYNHPNSQTYSIEAWGFKTFITAEVQTSVAPYIVNNLFLPK